jgi:hypothetical protein
MQIFARWLSTLWARDHVPAFPAAVWCHGATLLALHDERRS